MVVKNKSNEPHMGKNKNNNKCTGPQIRAKVQTKLMGWKQFTDGFCVTKIQLFRIKCSGNHHRNNVTRTSELYTCAKTKNDHGAQRSNVHGGGLFPKNRENPDLRKLRSTPRHKTDQRNTGIPRSRERGERSVKKRKTYRPKSKKPKTKITEQRQRSWGKPQHQCF